MFPLMSKKPHYPTAAFSPDSLSDLGRWYKADAITGLNDGDYVTTWSDSSGNSADVTQSTEANKPTYQTNEVNGQPIVRFDGGDALIASDVYQWDYSTGFSIFIVSKGNDSPSGTEYIFDNGVGDNNGIAFPRIESDDDITIGIGGVGAVTCANNHHSYSAFQILTCIYDGSDWSIRQNGATATITAGGDSDPSGSISGGGTTNFLAVGARGTDGTINYDGDVAEVIVYGVNLSSTDRDSVESYLSTKYDVSIS